MLNTNKIISFFNIKKLLLLILFILFQILIWYFYQENHINLENITNMIDIFPNTFLLDDTGPLFSKNQLLTKFEAHFSDSHLILSNNFFCLSHTKK